MLFFEFFVCFYIPECVTARVDFTTKLKSRNNVKKEEKSVRVGAGETLKEREVKKDAENEDEDATGQGKEKVAQQRQQ